jgi:hypothetical protein
MVAVISHSQAFVPGHPRGALAVGQDGNIDARVLRT